MDGRSRGLAACPVPTHPRCPRSSAAPAGRGMVPCLTHTPSGGSPSRESAYPPHRAQREQRLDLQDWHHLGRAPWGGQPLSSWPVPPPGWQCHLSSQTPHAASEPHCHPSWILRIPVGSIPWVFGCLSSVSWAWGPAGAWVHGHCLGQRSSCVYFPSAAGNNRGIFFFVIHFIFSRLCVFFTSQNPSCKHPAVSPGGGRCPASHSAGLSLLPTPSQHRGHRRVPTSPQLCIVPVTWLVTPGTPGISRNAGDTLAADCCQCQP